MIIDFYGYGLFVFLHRKKWFVQNQMRAEGGTGGKNRNRNQYDKKTNNYCDSKLHYST